MSLRVRLALLILALVALVAFSLSALHLRSVVESLSREASERADLAAQQVSSFLLAHVDQHADEYPPDQPDEQVWSRIAATDPHIEANNKTALGVSGALVEISVTDGGFTVLTSTTPERVGNQLKRYERLDGWMAKPWYERALDLLQRRQDWEVMPNPIGIAGHADPIFNMQVVISSVLLRNALRPELESLVQVLAGVVAVSLLLTFLVTTQAMRPLRRIEQTIDRIVQGSFAAATEKDEGAAKEFRAVESKLNLLGQQMREVMDSARESPHRLDVFVERMASQLDVASRLAAISRLSGGVAHEIKNPLNAIVLRLDLLKARIGEADPELESEIDVLSKEVLRLDRVVKTFLDFSRPVEVRYEDVDIAAVVREVAELMKPQAALAKIETIWDVGSEPAGFKAMMRGDPDLLKQAIINLVTNAIEAMQSGGGQLRYSVERGDGVWIVQIADNGPGIPPDRREKVFQLYFTTKTKGSGIGLAMTYRAVQLHNGVIAFTSESGKGTTFRMEFPAGVQHA